MGLRCLLCWVLISIGLGLTGQSTYSCTVSTDSVLLGNNVQIIYSAENVQVDFEGPEMRDLPLLAGPQISRSMSIINGNTSSVYSYTYVLKPQAIGVMTIPPAYFRIGEDIVEVPPFTILVLPNPEGVLQSGSLPKEIYKSGNEEAAQPARKFAKKKKKRL